MEHLLLPPKATEKIALSNHAESGLFKELI